LSSGVRLPDDGEQVGSSSGPTIAIGFRSWKV